MQIAISSYREVYDVKKYIIKVHFGGIRTLTFASKWYLAEKNRVWDVLETLRISGAIDDFDITEVESFESTF